MNCLGYMAKINLQVKQATQSTLDCHSRFLTYPFFSVAANASPEDPDFDFEANLKIQCIQQPSVVRIILVMDTSGSMSGVSHVCFFVCGIFMLGWGGSY